MENNNTPKNEFDKVDMSNLTPQEKAQVAVERFRALPPKAQIAIGVVFGFFALNFIFGGGDDPQVEQPQAQHNERAAATVSQESALSEGDEAFEAAGPSRESLQRGFYAQQRKEIALLKQELESQAAADRQALAEMRTSAEAQQQEMVQMMKAFNDQIKAFQESNNRQRQELSRLVDDARRQQEMQNRTSGMNENEVAPRTRGRIGQTTLGGAAMGVNANPDQALLNVSGKVKTGSNQISDGEYVERQPEPFLPPLGFVKATMLNGVDALVGRSSPVLVRMSGVYKTAMNSTVSLDGCTALVEFEGEISTERAIGKPSRMTCVYPDRGAVTYALSGYVVDAYDGIVGVPGVFYEGDASRLAAAMLADFSAGIASVVSETQFTTETSEGGVAKNMTGDQIKAEIGAGMSGVMGSLRDYLFERANRVVPFVRLDSTRDIHLVLLSGVELRSEGSAWTLLVDGEKADQVKAQNEAARRAAEKEQNEQL